VQRKRRSVQLNGVRVQLPRRKPRKSSPSSILFRHPRTVQHPSNRISLQASPPRKRASSKSTSSTSTPRRQLSEPATARKPHARSATRTLQNLTSSTRSPGHAARSERTRVSQDRVITGIAELAFYDIADLFDEKGGTPFGSRALANASPCDRRHRSHASSTRRRQEHWPGISKVKLADRKGNLELLGRHLKLFTDKVEHEAGASLEQILARSMAPPAST
jgi:hypothetical protein